MAIDHDHDHEMECNGWMDEPGGITAEPPHQIAFIQHAKLYLSYTPTATVLVSIQHPESKLIDFLSDDEHLM